MILQFLLQVGCQVAAIASETQMDLRFRSFRVTITELTDECRLISPLAPASAMFVQTDLEDLRIWSISENFSSNGQLRLRRKISIAES